MGILSSVGALFFHFCISLACTNHSAIDKEKYYNTFASNDLNSINKELSFIQSQTFTEKSAYEGALLMKKAAVIGNPKDKLAVFKDGNQKLETAIKNAPNNVEFRFLRFMIQENAPGFLGYKSNMDADKALLVAHFNTLAPEVQKAIRDYSKTSKSLSPELFQ